MDIVSEHVQVVYRCLRPDTFGGNGRLGQAVANGIVATTYFWHRVDVAPMNTIAPVAWLSIRPGLGYFICILEFLHDKGLLRHLPSRVTLS